MKKEKYVIFGSGGLAKEVIGYLIEMYGDDHGICAVISTQPFNNPEYSQRFPVRSEISPGEFPDAKFLLAVADPKVKKIIVEKNEDRWTNFVHSSAIISPFVKLGKGCIFAPLVLLAGDCVIGDYVFMNSNATVGHDSTIGNYTTLFPNTEVCGDCNIGQSCVFGIGSYVVPKVNLPNNTKVGAGAVVWESVDQSCLLVGNPAKPRVSSKITPTQLSLNLVRYISDNMEGSTFHHHYHILYDIANTFNIDKTVKFLEIGAYAGASACLMLQRKNTSVTSVDIGTPIPKNVVMNNVSKFNIHDNDYRYIQGNSHLASTYENLIGKYDIIFIDGDHSFDGVITDFQIYSKYLKDGGYIVFDDYNDSVHSPEVKPAVDRIVEILDKNEYHVIGTLSNTLGARGFPDGSIDGNCFVIKKV